MINWIKNLFKKKEPKVWNVCLWDLSRGEPVYYDMTEKEYEALMTTKLPPWLGWVRSHRLDDGSS